jgi:hypothetical protein
MRAQYFLRANTQFRMLRYGREQTLVSADTTSEKCLPLNANKHSVLFSTARVVVPCHPTLDSLLSLHHTKLQSR